MRIKSFIAGCSGTVLTAEEKLFFRDQRPWGFIVFARNINTPDQLSALTNEMRECVGRHNAPILIDQEGGRVRRLRPPHWPDYPDARLLGDLYREESQSGLRAGWLHARLMAHDMHDVGINVDCLPVLDVPVEGSHNVIGNRAYATDPVIVADMGRAVCEGMLAGGILPVIKHIPGHGRASVDSHELLPVVNADLNTLKATDFAPFKALSDLPLAMTAHVIYAELDAAEPATTSPTIIGEIIRNYMDFDGLLMSDDLSMYALSGDFSYRTEKAFTAGCDIVLHCNGDMTEMREVADSCPELSGPALDRANAAENRIRVPENVDPDALRAEFEGLVGSLV